MAKNIGRKTTGAKTKKVQINRKSTRSPSKRIPPTGHQYIIHGIDGNTFTQNKRGDIKTTITLIDVTDNAKIIQRRGVVRLFGNSGSIWLDNLEGHKNVCFTMRSLGKTCEIVYENGTYGLTPV